MHSYSPVSCILLQYPISNCCCVFYVAAGIATVGGITFSGSTQAAACLDISAQAQNASGKPLYNADVFGRVYDANGEAAIDDVSGPSFTYVIVIIFHDMP